MGYKVQFDSGHTVEFDREPTPADIEEAYSQVAKQKPVQSATDFLKGKMESERQVSRNILGGALRGAGSIGATLLEPIDWAARKAGIQNNFIGRTDRREAMDAALKDLGVDPESLSYGAGKIGTEIAGTAGVGGGLANLITKFAPKAAASAPGLMQAFRSGGLTGNAPVATRIAGGAIPGAIGAAAINPTAEDAGIGAAIGGTVPVVAPAIGKAVTGIRNMYDDTLRAKNILQGALRSNEDDVLRTLAQASDNVSTGQALADTNNPVLQALQQRADQRLSAINQATSREAEQELARQAALQEVAGGTTTQTGARQLEEQAVSDLSRATEPTKQRILEQANQTTDEMLGLQKVAGENLQGAADDVQRVRDFVAAGKRADNRAQQFYPVEGMPRISGRYSYMDTLAQKADEVANAYANKSLEKGQMARFAQMELQALEEAGLKPLSADSIISQINKNLHNEEFAGLKDMRKAMGMVEKELRYWADQDGVIGAHALDAIRKNVINSVATKLSQGNPTQQQKLAGALTEKLRPLLIKSMEDAGGKGYGNYLAQYAQSRQLINQSKLGAEAQRLYNESPEEFIKLVEGNSPDKVEKIFGVGSYDIAKELSSEALDRLGKVSKELRRDTMMKVQAEKGRAALEELIESNLPKFRLPMWFNWKATVGNKLLDAMEDKVGKQTMDILANSLQSSKSTADLLKYVPIGERMRIMSVIKNPDTWEGIPIDVRRAVQSGLTTSLSHGNSKHEQR